MRRQSWMIVCLFLALMAAAISASAQTVQPVLGVGLIAMDIVAATGDPAGPMTQARAQGQTYRLYVPATASSATRTLSVNCGVPNASAVVRCTFPLNVFTLPQTGSISFAVSAAVVAADGEVESAKVVAPFNLSRAGQPVGPLAAMSVLPPTP